MKRAVEMIYALRYKLQIFEVPIDGPVSVFCDNKVVYKNTVLSESTLNKKHHSIKGGCSNKIQVAKEGTLNNFSDIFTKVMSAARRTFLLYKFLINGFFQ